MSPQTRAQRNDAALLARGAFVNLLGNLGRFSRALSLMLMAWLFGAEALGVYVLAWATTEFLRRFVSYGIEPAIVFRLGPALTSRDDQLAANIVASSLLVVTCTGIIGFLAMFLGGGFLAETVLGEPRLTEAFRAFGFVMPAFGISSVFLAATRAKKVMRFEILARSVVEPFVLLVGTLIAWAVDGGVFALALAQTSAFWASAVLCIFFYRTLFPLRSLAAAMRGPFCFRSILGYATPVAAKDVVAQGVARIDLFLVGRLLDATAVGVYGIVLELVALSRHVRQALEPILAPLVAEQHSAADRERLRRTYANATRWALLMSLGLFGLAQIAGDTVLSVYGNVFRDGGTALAVLFFGQIVNGTLGLSETVLLMAGRPGLMLGDMILLLVMIGVFNVAAIQAWGLTGAAIGTASATTLVVLLQVRQTRKKVGVHPWSWGLLKPMMACGIGVSAAYLFPTGDAGLILTDVIRGGVFLLTYGVLVVLFGVEPEERHLGEWVLKKCRALRRNR